MVGSGGAGGRGYPRAAVVVGPGFGYDTISVMDPRVVVSTRRQLNTPVLKAGVGTVAESVSVVTKRCHLIVEEEERLVFANRTADRKAELVADVRILGTIRRAVEPVPRSAETFQRPNS